MEYFVGIDLGTSSVRAVAVDAAGKTAAAGQCEYDIKKPGLDRRAGYEPAVGGYGACHP